MAMPQNYFLSIREATSSSGTIVDDTSLASWFTDGVNGTNIGYVIENGTATFDLDNPLASGWLSICFDREGSWSTALGGPHDVVVMSGATTDLFRIRTSAFDAGTWNLEYWDGATWQQAGSTVVSPEFNDSVGWRLDVFFNINDTGEISAYTNGGGTAAATFSGDTFTTADTQITSVTINDWNVNAGRECYYSPLIVDNVDTRDLFIAQAGTSSLGDFSEWDSQAESSIDDLTPTMNMNTNINTSVLGDRVTYNMAGLDASVDGKVIEGVAMYALGEGYGQTPFFIDGLCSISATAYESVTASYQFQIAQTDYVKWEFPVDPSTSLDWANAAAVEAAEFGFITKNS